MRKIIFLSILISLVFTGCQEVVDSDNLLDAEERVSIIGYLSPSDTILRVSVSKALPAIGQPIQFNEDGTIPKEFLITNAMVSIANANGDSSQLMYNQDINSYIADATSLEVETGNDYFLSVIVGDKEFNASCTIPEPIETIDETITFRNDEFGGPVAAVNLSFLDFKNENNFYVLGGIYEASIRNGDLEPFKTRRQLFFDGDVFQTDNVNEGGILNGTSEVFLESDENIVDASITLQVANVEEILFQHLRTTRTNSNADGNPFVEFAIAPNNFLDDGAIGIFAGYSLTQKVIELK